MDTLHSSDGTTIAFDRVGDGPPLIYVGGALNDRFAGAALAALLADRFTVINYDRRGRGNSGDTQPYAVDREIEDLAAVIAEAGGSAAVFGMSSGAVLTMKAAAHGLPITRVAAYEPPIRPDNDGNRRAVREYAAKLTELVAEDRGGDVLELFMTAAGMPGELIGQMRRTPSWTELEALARSLAYDSAVMEDARGGPVPSEWVGAITVPTLLFSGGASPDWMRDTAEHLARAVSDGRHVILPDQTHNMDAEVVGPVLADFLLA